MDMRMTESAAWMIGLMGFLVVLVAAVLVAMRVFGARAAEGDHPHHPAAVRDALTAAQVAPKRALAGTAATPSALERGGDPVEDVGLRHHQ